MKDGWATLGSVQKGPRASGRLPTPTVAASAISKTTTLKDFKSPTHLSRYQ